MTIDSLVERERRHLRRGELLAAVLLGAGTLALLLAGAAVLLGHARWLALPRAIPFVVWLVVAAALAALAERTRRRLGARTSRADVALAIETEQGLRRGLLVGALELEGQGPLAARAATAARAKLPTETPLAPAMRRASSRRAMTGAGVAAAGLLVLVTASPLFGDGLRAVFRPIDAWRGALLARPRIEGAPRELLRGAPLHLTLHAPGRTQLLLSVRETGEAWRTDTIAIDPRSGTARWSMEALQGDLHLVASDGRASSDSVVVHAADRPFVGAVTLQVSYPVYLGRPSESLPLGEVLRLPRGTALTIAGRASVPLASVELAGARDRIALATEGHNFSGRLVADHSAQLRWIANGASGVVSDVPAPLDIEILADSAPQVAISAPTSDTVIAVEDHVNLTLTASDDHGIARVDLRIARIAPRGDLAPVAQPVAGAVGTAWAGSAPVDISALRLQPGDAVRVRAEAVDASPWAQRGVSRELVIKRPTMEEQREVARALGDSAVKEARAAASAQRALAQRTDEAARAQARQGSTKSGQENSSSSSAGSQQKGAMNYESAEKARALAQEQRAMTDRVQKLRQATQQLEQQLKAAGALDTALARQLGEAQALMRQALTPELMAQMQKLESAAQQMNGDQSRDALRDLAQMQQRMREQLEKSAEMLKRAAHEGAMQTLGDQARELAAKERALADSGTKRDGDGSGADKKAADARAAAELAQQTERLREQMEGLKERLAKDKAEAGATRTEQAQEHAAKSATGMRRAANEMKSGKEQNASSGSQKEQAVRESTPQDQRAQQSAAQRGESKSGTEQGGGQGSEQREGAERAREAANEMDRAAQSMQEARASQVKEWKKELTSELDQAVQEMMQLAREERALEQKARSGGSEGDRRGAQSAVEQGVDKANERLQGAGKKSALLSPRSQRAVAEAKSKVAQATQSISQPNGNQSQQANALSDAADALTKAAASLARDRERANNASSASGFSEMLQQMKEAAQKQGQINSQAQNLMSMPNGTSSASGQSLARALAQKQRSLADQLDDAGDGASGERAAQLATEARQLAEALDNGRLDASTIARQQQLFRRLLDAGRSLEKEEREDSGKREAKSAGAQDAFSPNAKVDPKAAMRFRPPTWQELRGLSAEERRAILDYFTRLNNAPSP